MTPPMPSISSVPLAPRSGVGGERHQRIEIDGAALAPRRHVGRQRRGKTPGRDAVDLGGRDRPAQRREQHAWIARRGRGRDRNRSPPASARRPARPGGAPMPDQAGGDEGLADVGAGRGDEDRAHALRRMRVRTISASRAISASGCAALNDSRSRAVPSGTVGGRIATARIALGFEQLRGRERRCGLADHHRHDRALRLRQAGGAGEGAAPWRAAARAGPARVRSGRARRSRRRRSPAAGRSNRSACGRGCG